jgi:hypothetical protein
MASSEAQKDKTSNWKSPIVVSGNVTVSTNSVAAGKNHYETFSIKPYAADMMRFFIYASGNYIMKIKSKNNSFVDKRLSNGNSFIFKLPDTDSLSIQLVGAPTDAKATVFTYSYSIGDTTKKILTAQQPQDIFEELLPLASNKFQNLYNGIDGNGKDIEYPTGLFFSKRAVCENGWIKQLTGAALDEKAAIKDNADWNKKIKAWLKDYKVTDIKKLDKAALRAKSNSLYDEATEYTKRNAKGDILFVVSVYKTEDSEGYYTGVLISNK